MLFHAVVRGRVQGVGFRYFVRREAQELGLTGWVRNCPDGSVELEAEGDAVQLAELEKRLRQGPALSRVDEVTVDHPAGPGGYTEFVVRS